MSSKRVKRTVTFWEIRDRKEEEVAQIDWQAIFADLESQREIGSIIDLRHDFNGAGHYVQIYRQNDEGHLVLARERDEPPSRLDVSSGEIVDAASGANNSWVEVSVSSFLPNSNVFGFVLGSMASPRAGAIADWVNAHRLFQEPLTVVPYVNPVLLDKLGRESSEARLVHISLDAAQIEAPSETSGLYSRAQELGRALDLGPQVDVEVVLRIAGRTRSASPQTRRHVAALAREAINFPMKRAKVEVVDPENLGADREVVDLVKHSMSRKMDVSVMDDEGHQVRIPSAINAICKAAPNLEDLADEPIDQRDESLER